MKTLYALILLSLSGCTVSYLVGEEEAEVEETNRNELLALHQKMLEAHRQSNVDLLLEDSLDEYVVANRGEISRPSLEERKRVVGHYFDITQFTEYRDLEEPVVKVSEDGTLGWVIAQVEAKGMQQIDNQQQPVEFVSAWIELYQKQDGNWVQIGNVSNFKP